jgi:hypothetical protein
VFLHLNDAGFVLEMDDIITIIMTITFLKSSIASTFSVQLPCTHVSSQTSYHTSTNFMQLVQCCPPYVRARLLSQRLNDDMLDDFDQVGAVQRRYFLAGLQLHMKHHHR